LKIRIYHPDDQQILIQLISEFRSALAGLRNMTHKVNIEAAYEELCDYTGNDFPIYVSENDNEEVIGYVVCRVVEDVVWAESLFVSPKCRRKGIGSALFKQAEQLAQKNGNFTLYNWIHPNNQAIIDLLHKQGYNVLNLIELRRSRGNEKETQKIKVGKNEFSY